MARKINERLKISVIGCGACGNSITAAIEEKIHELGGDKSNTTFVGINTSTEDLASVNLSHKIHINNSKGAACNRESSIQDLAEIEACLRTPSFSIITKTNKEKGTTANVVDILSRDSNIFAKREDKTVSVIGISEAVSAKESKIDMMELRKEVGTAPMEYHGYLSESEENVIILSGLVMPYTRVDIMTESIQKEADIIKNSRKATMEVRTAKTLDVFDSPVVEETKQTTDKPKGLSALEKLKAKRISK